MVLAASVAHGLHAFTNNRDTDLLLGGLEQPKTQDSALRLAMQKVVDRANE